MIRSSDNTARDPGSGPTNAVEAGLSHPPNPDMQISKATAGNFVDAITSGDALLAECNVTIKDSYFDFTFSGLCEGSAYSSDQAIVVLQTEGAQSANALEYFFIFPSTALVNDEIPASWNGEAFWSNASNPIGLGAYEGNCYVSDVAKVCVEPK